MLLCRLTITDPMEDKIKRLPGVITRILKRIIKLWHTDTLPKHFKLGAARRYGYERRSIKYQRAKQKRMLPALVWSGRTRDKLTSPGHFKVTGSKASAKGKFINVNSIKYFWMRPAGHPNKAAETTRLSNKEEGLIKNVLAQSIAPELNKTRGRKKVVR